MALELADQPGFNWVWLFCDDAEVAKNQQNTGIDGAKMNSATKAFEPKIASSPDVMRSFGDRHPRPLGRRPFIGSPSPPPPDNFIVHCFKHLGSDLTPNEAVIVSNR
jgi:hypothetical protein